MNVIVPSKIAIQGADLISNGIKNSFMLNVISGVELMLLNNLSTEGDQISAGKGQSDVSILLRQGLDYLSKSPHEALGVPIGAKTTQIRKAYKQHALKYHPDKNPKTTPLFQVMNMACDKLSDPILREKEERALAAKQPPKPYQPPQQQQPNNNNNNNTSNNSNNAQVPPQQPCYTGFVPPQSHGTGANAFHPKPTTTSTNNNPSPRPNLSTSSSTTNTSNNSSYPSNPSQFPPNFKPKYDPKTNKWNVDAEWAKYAQQQQQQHPINNNNNNINNTNNNNTNNPNKQQAEQNYRNQEANKRKQYYEEIIREQFNKAESERKAKEYASMREMAAKQRAKYEEDLKTKYQEHKDNKESSSSTDNVYSNRNINKPIPTPISSTSSNTNNPSSNTNNPSNSNGSIPNTNNDYNPNNPASFAYANNSNNNSSGNLKGMGGMKPIPNPTPVTRVPRPYGLRCVFIGTNAAELEWVTSKYHRNNLLVELSWRNKALGAKAWESANKLISSGKCRKKNLTPGADYDFRVRAVEELAGGLLGYRSDWSDSISITLMADKTTNSTSSSSDLHSTSSAHNLLHKQNSYNSSKLNINTPSNESNTTEIKTAIPTASTTASAAKIHKFERFNPLSTSTNDNNTNNNTSTTTKEKKSESTNNKASTEIDRHSYPPNNNKIPIYIATSINSNTNNNYYSNTSNDSNIIHEMTKVKLDNNNITKRFPPSSSTTTTIPNPSIYNNPTLSSSAKFAWDKDIIDEIVEEDEDNFKPPTTSEETQTLASSNLNVKKNSNYKKKNVKKKISNKNNLDDLEVDEEISDNDEDIDDDIIINSNDPINITNKTTYQPNDGLLQVDNIKLNVNNVQTISKPMPPSIIPSSSAKTTNGIKQTEYDDFIIEEDDDYDKEHDGFEEDEEIIEKIYKLIPPASKVKGSDHHMKTTTSTSKNTIYAHPVRAEPFIKSNIVGYLIPGMNVVSNAECGSWLKVSIHKQPNRKNNNTRSSQDTNLSSEASNSNITTTCWGWSVKADRQNEYLVLLDTTKGHHHQYLSNPTNIAILNNIKSIDRLTSLQSKTTNIITTPTRTTRNTTATTTTSNTTTTTSNTTTATSNTATTSATSITTATAQPSLPVRFEPMTPPPLLNKKASYRSLANLSMHAIPHSLSPAVTTNTTNTSNTTTSNNSSTTTSYSNNHVGSKINAPTNPSDNLFKEQFLPNHVTSNNSKSSSATTNNSTTNNNSSVIIEEWSELYDVDGHVYYYNEARNESKWEPPEWVEECDPDSGAKYYVHLGDNSMNDNNELYSTWTKPEKFARLLRT